MSYNTTYHQLSGVIKQSSSRSGRSELRGPRPSPLRVSSSTIKKPSCSSNQSKQQLQQQQQQAVNPVVIYLRSPKIIHVRPEEFMSLVQRLTGKDSSAITRTSTTTSTTTTTTTTNNNNNPSTSSPSSSPSCHHMDAVADARDPNESMKIMMISKRSDDDHHQIMKPAAAAAANFDEVDIYADQILGLSPTWLRSLACV